LNPNRISGYAFGVPKSLELARPFLGKTITVMMDRPLGSKHPKWGFVYEANYGFIAGRLAPDGMELDVYYIGVDEPLEQATVTVLLSFTALMTTMTN
jgi:inorganic pyrophosphatase